MTLFLSEEGHSRCVYLSTCILSLEKRCVSCREVNLGDKIHTFIDWRAYWLQTQTAMKNVRNGELKPFESCDLKHMIVISRIQDEKEEELNKDKSAWTFYFISILSFLRVHNIQKNVANQILNAWLLVIFSEFISTYGINVWLKTKINS